MCVQSEKAKGNWLSREEEEEEEEEEFIGTRAENAPRDTSTIITRTGRRQFISFEEVRSTRCRVAPAHSTLRIVGDPCDTSDAPPPPPPMSLPSCLFCHVTRFAGPLRGGLEGEELTISGSQGKDTVVLSNAGEN